MANSPVVKLVKTGKNNAESQFYASIKCGNPSTTPKFEVIVNGVPIHNISIKRSSRARNTFTIWEAWFWVSLAPNDILRASFDGKFASFKVGSRMWGRTAKPYEIASASATLRIKKIIGGILDRLIRYSQKPDKETIKKYNNAWLLMDRDDKADDNSEHLYRYLKNHHPTINIYFVIRTGAADFVRLEKEGFNLVAFKSRDHKNLLMFAQVAIFSNIKASLTNPFKLLRGISKKTIKHKTVFLQHGTTMSDYSSTYNRKNIDLFVTSTRPEHNSIVGQSTQYKFTDREVKFTGFPRWDHLKKLRTNSRTLLIMPTWRKYLSSANGYDRTINLAKAVKFFTAWQLLLNSRNFWTLVEQFKLNVVLAPHPNLVKFQELFQPQNVELDKMKFRIHDQFKDGSLQNLFADAALLITDYSSVAFDVAFLQKPVVYYQFDSASIQTEHTSSGYFNYERDGFGPVCSSTTEVENAIASVMSEWSKLHYSTRSENTFTHRDLNNCKRVLDEIMQIL